jgi:hypothetical protein
MTITLKRQTWLQPAKKTLEIVTAYRYRTGAARDM